VFAVTLIAFFFKWSPFRHNGGKVKVVLGRGVCEDFAELPHVRVALEFHVHVCFYACVVRPRVPPSPLLPSSNPR
jgi:hypothetical protein